MSKRIFVTGGTGLVGSNLLHRLVGKGNQVLAMRRGSSSMQLVKDIENQITWIEGDLLDVELLYDNLINIDEVYHCAAVVSFDPRDKEAMFKINIEGTANLVNAALEHQVGKFLHVSSIAALGRALDTPKVDEKSVFEKSPLNSNYAISKHRSEMEVWRGVAEGLNAVIINPSVILGNGFWDQGSGKLFTEVWNGLKFYPRGGTGFVDVRDVVSAMLQLMDSDISGERFILNADNLSYQSFFNKVALALQKPAPSIEGKPWLAEIAWRVEWLKSMITGSKPIITRETVRSSAHRFYYDNTKLIQALDFAYTPAEQSIRDTAQHFLAARGL